MNVRETFDFVARCENVRRCLNDKTLVHPCRTIVDYQSAPAWGGDTYETFQLPEPWVGEIDHAPILFLSSNPSIGKDRHALGASSPDEIWDSHHFLYGGGRGTYTIDGKYKTDSNGRPITPPVNTWAFVRKRAEELIPSRAVIPGIDYALTEVVHCKSRGEVGVREALSTCVERHLEAVMRISAARVVIAMGKAREPVRAICGIDRATKLARADLGGRLRLVAFLGHPTGTERRTFAEVYADELSELRNAVSAADTWTRGE
jgi:hypothetical protein